MTLGALEDDDGRPGPSSAPSSTRVTTASSAAGPALLLPAVVSMWHFLSWIDLRRITLEPHTAEGVSWI
ncbi:hypothetical protein [Thermobifida alba]|uniref:hypothetical protein n=1 Tax=Thermobifida alba TaxID=53522 RepID=UPI0020BE9014|nr:hypothetical protein [Thermobifida alba]